VAHSGPAEPAIETVDLAKRYGRTDALAGLSMRVERGEIFGFLGPNGAGKTTAVKLLLGLARPTAGGGTVLGARLGDLETRARIGYLPELFRYQPWLRAGEVVALHCELARLPRAAWPAEIARALTTVGLADRSDDFVGTFSKGMQQRLGLGVALLGRPELIFLDEPTSALDPIGRRDVRDIIRAARDRGATVFLNSHLLTEVERVCDRVAIVDHGRMIASGAPDALGGESSVRIRVTDLTEEARNALGQAHPFVDEDDWLRFRGLPADDIPEVVAAIVAAGGRVHAVEPGRTTLEERFVELIRDGAA